VIGGSEKMKILIVGIVIFIVAAVVIELCLYGYRSVRYPDRRKIQKRLWASSYGEYGPRVPDIVKKRVLSKVPTLTKILLHVTGIEHLERLIRQADAKYPLGFFMLLTVVLALSGFSCGLLISRNQLISVSLAVLSAGIPLLYILMQKKKRMQKFTRQLPDALEFIARSLRAGHAFTSGMKMAAAEFDDPLGSEFDATLDEINFGVSVHDALKSLAHRIDCPDLKFFVVSVILQRETGGNLGEIIESIAYLIRERFKLQGKIKVLSAEGRLSAIVLIALPFVAVIAMRFMNPEYINTLFSEPAGRIAAGIAVCMVFIGILVIRRMIKINV